MLRRRSAKYPDSTTWGDFTRAYFAERRPYIDKPTLLRFVHDAIASSKRFEFNAHALDDWLGKMVILSSKDDARTYPRLSALQARYPRANTHVFEEGGHHSVFLYPVAYIAALEVYLTTR